ncbi:polysaccharide biosynthesis/export family protein [Sphingomonas lenta]|nr:polysaccharide biosynthesis/export family protein [Sphingomonas lenta]
MNRCALASAILLAGCSSGPRLVSTPNLDVVRMERLPAPTRPDLVAADRASFIGPLDTIGVDVFNVPDLTRELRVDASGRISMPLIGEMDVRGKTANEVAAMIEAQLDRYVRNPQVTVNVRNSVSQVVTVDGSVNEPGLYPVTNQTTLVRAVASAKGLSEFGRSEDVVILRTVNNRRIAGLYNLDAIRRGTYEDPPIFANDLVIVGDSKERRMFQDFLAIAPLLSAPLIVALQ